MKFICLYTLISNEKKRRKNEKHTCSYPNRIHHPNILFFIPSANTYGTCCMATRPAHPGSLNGFECSVKMHRGVVRSWPIERPGGIATKGRY